MPLLDKLNFLSKHPIDKIVQEGEVTVVNDGDTGTDYQTAKIVTSTTANSYGRACLARARWSIDGGSNWQALEGQLVYTFLVQPFGATLDGLDSAISVGCSDSLVYFRTANGRHGTVTNADSTPSYTPTSRTFLIQYALYERA